MLIIPAEHPLDWKRPPLITLLLILLNVVIYFGYQGGDSERRSEAAQLYLDEGLLNRERAPFIDTFATRHKLDEEQREQVGALRRPQLASLIISDLQFEQSIHQRDDYRADAAWQSSRAKVEQLRNRISSVRFGFIPAQFTVQGLFGAMFLHGSVEHLLGNMVFLFIFGFALEIALGRWVYLSLYLLGGVASHLLWWAMDPVWVTGVGASGAISGLMGLYIGVYGLRRINFFYWLGPLFGYFRAPALWIFPIWVGKELYGLLLADDHVNYYAHLGGLLAGFAAIVLLRLTGRVRIDEAYLHKQDADAPFKRELATLEQLISQFALPQASARGLDMLTRYPDRLALLERLYPLALSRQDRPLLAAVLKQLLALPAADAWPLLTRLATDAGKADQPLLQNAALHRHLLQRLLQSGKGAALALVPWRYLSRQQKRPGNLPALTLQLAKQLTREQNHQAVSELRRFLESAYPQAEQTELLRRSR